VDRLPSPEIRIRFGPICSRHGVGTSVGDVDAPSAFVAGWRPHNFYYPADFGLFSIRGAIDSHRSLRSETQEKVSKNAEGGGGLIHSFFFFIAFPGKPIELAGLHLGEVLSERHDAAI